MNKLDSNKILQALPQNYYVINCKTFKIIDSNDQDVNCGIDSCYKKIFDFDEPCYKKGLRCACREVIEKQGGVQLIKKFKTDSGFKIQKVIANPVFNNKNELEGVISQYIDITDDLKSEEKSKNEISTNEEFQKAIEEFEKAKSALNDREQKIKNIFENSTNMFYQHNIDHVITYISPQVKDILGYTVEEAMIKWTDLMTDNPINLEGLKQTEKAIKTGVAQASYELELEHKSGKSVWVEVREAPLLSNGKTIAIVGALTDITENKIAANALKEGEEQYRKLFQSANVGIGISTLSGNIITVNNAMTKIFKYSFKEFVKINSRSLYLDKKDRNLIIDVLKKEGENQNRQIQMLTKYNKKLWVQISMQNFNLEGNNRILFVISDITKQKEAEIALSENEKKFRTYIESSPTAIFIVNAKGQYEYANKAVSKLLGYSMNELLKMSIPEIKITSGGENVLEDFNELKKTGELKGRETKYKTKKGHIVDVLIDAVKLSNNKYITYCTDISELKNYESKLKVKNEEYHSLNEELQKHVEQIQNINLDLQLAKEQAEESDCLKSAFLANMSHELRTPLNGILGFSALLRKEDLSKDARLRYSEIIESSGLRLLNVVSDLFDISLIQSNQLKIEKSIFELNPLLNEIYTFYCTVQKSKLKNINFKLCKNSEKNIKINNDKHRVHQIFKNLIDNAFKFTAEGEIEFGYLTTQSNQITFYVKDTGIGIPYEHQKNIFSSFRQVDDSNTRNYEGTGLGLSICSGLLERMGGEIWIESQKGMGATLYFTLPLSNVNLDNKVPAENNIQNKKLQKIK